MKRMTQNEPPRSLPGSSLPGDSWWKPESVAFTFLTIGAATRDPGIARDLGAFVLGHQQRKWELPEQVGRWLPRLIQGPGSSWHPGASPGLLGAERVKRS